MGTNEEKVQKNAGQFREFINKSNILTTLGKDIFLNDAYPLVVKDKGKSRVSFLIRIKNEKEICEQIKEILLSYILKYQRYQVKLIADVEPIRLY